MWDVWLRTKNIDSFIFVYRGNSPLIAFYQQTWNYSRIWVIENELSLIMLGTFLSGGSSLNQNESLRLFGDS